MKYDPNIHRRRSVRLQGYDYSQAGAYFITICTQGRECLFGAIENGEMMLSECGQIAHDEWLKSAKIRSEIELGEYVIMPNHFHGILIIGRGTARRAPTVEQFGQPVSGSLPTIIRAFKSAITKRINEMRQSPGVSIWQRNYFEHVIRNEADYRRITEYVENNPRQWEEDSLHPKWWL